MAVTHKVEVDQGAIGAGLTGTESGASGGYKHATITAGTGSVSWE